MRKLIELWLLMKFMDDTRILFIFNIPKFMEPGIWERYI